MPMSRREPSSVREDSNPCPPPLDRPAADEVSGKPDVRTEAVSAKGLISRGWKLGMGLAHVGMGLHEPRTLP